MSLLADPIGSLGARMILSTVLDWGKGTGPWDLDTDQSLDTGEVGLPWWLSGKESTSPCRRCGFDPWIGKIPWRRKWQPTPVVLSGKSHGQRSLAGYSLWGRTESDMTCWLNDNSSNNPLGREGWPCIQLLSSAEGNSRRIIHLRVINHQHSQKLRKWVSALVCWGNLGSVPWCPLWECSELTTSSTGNGRLMEMLWCLHHVTSRDPSGVHILKKILSDL